MPLPRQTQPNLAANPEAAAVVDQPAVAWAKSTGTTATAPMDADRAAGASATAYLLSSARGMLSPSGVNTRLRQKLRAAQAAVTQAAAPISTMAAWVAQSKTMPPNGANGTYSSGTVSAQQQQPPIDLFEEVEVTTTGPCDDFDAAMPAGAAGAPVDLLDPATLRALSAAAARSRQQGGVVSDDMDVDLSACPPAGVPLGMQLVDVETIAKKAESEENLKRTSTPGTALGSLANLAPFSVPHLWTVGSKPVLALDLDETLIHSSLVPKRAPDFTIDVVQNGDARTRETFFVYKRPYVEQFLTHMAKHYHVIVFTAGIREYASQILDRLDPKGELVKARLYRDSCTEVRTGGTTFAKDMTKCVSDVRKVLLVDNTPGCFGIQPANGVLIKSWYTDPTDRQLVRLAEFLTSAKGADDLRLAAREWNPHA